MVALGWSQLIIFYLMTSMGVMRHADARSHHHHKRHGHYSHQISIPPEASQPPLAAAPSPDGVYDVRMFGGVGDGVADDTDAFKTAWDSACQTHSGVLLVPHGYTFMIQSTIFTGPCQNGFVFQVAIYTFIY